MGNLFDDIREVFGTTRTTPTDGLAGYTPLTGLDGASAYALAALAQECGNVAAAPEGTRNAALNKAAYNLGQLVGGGELPLDTVRQELTTAAQANGLPDNEIQATLNSGGAAGALNPRTKPADPIPAWLETITTSHTTPATTAPQPLADQTPAEPGPTPQDAAQPPADVADTAEETTDQIVHRVFPRLNWADLWADETVQEWIVEPLLPARRLVALYSPPKTGKSLLMLEIAAAVAAGRPVLGTTPDRARRVLYVDFENDPKDDIRSRLQAMGYAPTDLDNLVYLSFPTMAALDDERGSLELLAAVTTYQCEVVVIDTVSRSIKGDENENDTWLNFYRHTGLKLKQNGISLIRLDHSGKDPTKGQRGGSAKEGDVDAVWRMATVVPDGTYSLTCELNRMPIGEKFMVLQRALTPHLHHVVQGAGRYAAMTRAAAAIVAHLDRTNQPANLGADKVRVLLRSTGIQAGNKVIAEAIRERKAAALINPELPFPTDRHLSVVKPLDGPEGDGK